MIIGFIGARGSGKTLGMTIEAYKKYKQGYKIFSNYHLNFPYTPFTINDLLNFAESGMYFGNTIFCIDEIHIYFDSRCSGKKRNIIFSYFLNQSSKNDIDVYYSSQFSRQVEIRLRLNTEIVVECNAKSFLWTRKGASPVMIENYRPKPTDYRCETFITCIYTQFGSNGKDNIIKRMYHANKYFKLYDTREVIKQQKDIFEIAKSMDKRNKLEPVEIPKPITSKEKRRLQHENRIYHEELFKEGAV